jgi:hypothetical protein
VARNAAEHPFAESRVAVGAGNHGARPDIGSNVLELPAAGLRQASLGRSSARPTMTVL